VRNFATEATSSKYQEVDHPIRVFFRLLGLEWAQ